MPGSIAAALLPSAQPGGADSAITPASATGAAPPPADAPAAVASTRPQNGLEPEVAFVLSSMMREVIQSGTGSAARVLARPLAGKTGTAQEHRDAWFVGFSPSIVAGVWVGFDSHDAMGSHETGAGAALPAWISFMREASPQPTDFQAPRNVEYARVDPVTGLLADPGTARATVLPFVSGTVPKHTASEPPPGSEPQNFFMEQ